MTRYFACRNLRSIDKDFVTSCETEDEVDELFDQCSDYLIDEITVTEYEEHLRASQPSGEPA